MAFLVQKGIILPTEIGCGRSQSEGIKLTKDYGNL